MAGEAAAGDTVSLVLLGKMPEDDGFVAWGGDDHVGVVDGSGNRRHNVGVGAHGATENKIICHFFFLSKALRIPQLGFSFSLTATAWESLLVSKRWTPATQAIYSEEERTSIRVLGTGG